MNDQRTAPRLALRNVVGDDVSRPILVLPLQDDEMPVTSVGSMLTPFTKM
jgi:hypothetical protein